ncbi:LysR family transcriptional regulator [Moritella sp. 24]|uniref:LysR family transcriptional regulator n=1 Tax=Moritella sp. 24 TaxID=2746230 RepID=UPI001BAC9753|nr:LysR family transcriptional regulator [Moritella sp. 24]QUM76775.1 LysR family transcriptional regulator [Moritella sp. 24]
MDLNLLRVFDAVMKLGSVNATADMLDITAPAVSHSLNRLREQYNDPLFIRKGRGIIPTNFAIELHADIQAPLDLLVNSTKSRQVFNPLTSTRTFRISSHKDIDLVVLPKLLQYKEKHAPSINIISDIEHLDSDEQLRHDDLILRKVDLVFATVPLKMSGYHNEIILEQDLLVACSINHPRIDDQLSQQQFFNEKHLLWTTKRLNDDVLHSLSLEKLPYRKIAYRAGSMASALIMASQTEWLCLTSQWYADTLSAFAPIKILTLPFAMDPLPVYMTWHQSQNADVGLRWLRQTILDVLKDET